VPNNIVDLDIQFQTTQFNVVVHKGDTPTIRAYLYENDEAWIPTSDYTAHLAYTTGYETNNAPNMITGDISTTSNYVEFILNTNTSSFATTDYFTQIALRNNTKQYVFGDGMLRIKKSPIGVL